MQFLLKTRFLSKIFGTRMGEAKASNGHISGEMRALTVAPPILKQSSSPQMLHLTIIRPDVHLLDAKHLVRAMSIVALDVYRNISLNILLELRYTTQINSPRGVAVRHEVLAAKEYSSRLLRDMERSE